MKRARARRNRGVLDAANRGCAGQRVSQFSRPGDGKLLGSVVSWTALSHQVGFVGLVCRAALCGYFRPVP
jgi:hypothetical protein